MIILWWIGFSLAYAHHIEKSFFMRNENSPGQKQCGFHFLPTVTNEKGPAFISMGGRLVEPNEYPFAVHIDTDLQSCTGVLISKRYVLTAAHCLVGAKNEAQEIRMCGLGPWNARRVDKYVLKPAELSIYPGSRCPNPESCTPYRTKHNIRLVNPHPEYNICNGENDIALIELEEDVSEKDAVPICVPDENEMLSGLLSAIGYGDNPYAKDPEKPALRVVDFENYIEDNGKIITIDRARSICPGDSGGPLFKKNKDGLTLVGIAFAITPECSKYNRVRKGYYTDVRKHLYWICEYSGVCYGIGKWKTKFSRDDGTNFGEQHDTDIS
ncbi:hypothetical protein RB195_021281 [Necator americanus]|uniref:Peptidase S1 domain-containing protein n=1 Tax=Necator americanus TaxID=51031 RepID=A0ABR1EAW9_NECAM